MDLTTTTGEKLAPSVAYIKATISRQLSEKAGYDISATIIGIEHLDMPKGLYVSAISYETSTGVKGKVHWTNGILGKDGKLSAPNPKTRYEFKAEAGKSYQPYCGSDTCQDCPEPTTSSNGLWGTVICGACGNADQGNCSPGVWEVS